MVILPSLTYFLKFFMETLWNIEFYQDWTTKQHLSAMNKYHHSIEVMQVYLILVEKSQTTTLCYLLCIHIFDIMNIQSLMNENFLFCNSYYDCVLRQSSFINQRLSIMSSRSSSLALLLTSTREILFSSEICMVGEQSFIIKSSCSCPKVEWFRFST
jgi:thioredoxin-related protein